MTGSRWLLGSLLLIGGAAATLYYYPDLIRSQAKTDAAPTFTTTRGPLLISVTESGTIQAREQEVLKNEVEGRTTILHLIEEGTPVKKGDLLIKLDVSDLEDQRIEREIKVQNAEATMIGAREEVEVTKSQAQSDVAKAELDNRFAKEDLESYLAGEYPRSLKELEAKITLALEELENANETLQWSETLFLEKYISQTELDRDRLARSRANLDHELAVSALELFDQYTHRRRVDELESEVEQMEMALEREKRKAKASIVQSEADLRAKESEFQRQTDQLNRINDQLSKATILAPVDGMVVHATTGKGNWRGNDEPLKEGREVREREDLIYLPVANSMMAKISIHESALDKVTVGQRVQITVEALPGRVFAGEISRIAPLPDAQSVWMNPDLKVYPTEINLDGRLEELRTGMTCRAEILVDNIQNAIYVPLQCIVRVENQPRVYVRGADGQFAPRDVTIGLDNRHMVHVKKGLDEGELVMLAPPLEQGARRLNVSGAEGFAPDDAPAGGPTGGPPATDGAPSGKGKGKGKPGGGGGRAPRGEKPSAEQLEVMRKKMSEMSPEEQAAIRSRMPAGDQGTGDTSP